MYTGFFLLVGDTAPIRYAYIDPSTGSMLFTILIGAISVLMYSFKGFLIKLRFSFHKEASQSETEAPFVFFSDDKRYWTTFRPICDEMEKRGQSVLYLTQSEDDPALSSDYQHVKAECIGKGNKAFAKMNMLNADIVLSTTPSLDVYQWKRSKNVRYYIHVLHAISDVVLYRMFGIDYYDALILSGEFQVDQVRKLEKKRGLKEKELVILGLPYVDELLKRSKALEKKENRNKTVLLAPSWGENSILSKYGSKMLDALLSTGYHIVVRPHPQSFNSEKEMMDDLMKKYPESEQLEWNRDNDNFDVLSRSDILISDFSGIIFDYSLVFDKPVIYADVSFDDSVYDIWWLDEEAWTFSVLPKLGVQLKDEDLNDIKSVIDRCSDSEEIRKGREEVRAECWANPGESSVLIADYLIRKHEELLRGDRS